MLWKCSSSDLNKKFSGSQDKQVIIYIKSLVNKLMKWFSIRNSFISAFIAAD